MEDAARLIETNLVLLGATAIEDKLQDKVRHATSETRALARRTYAVSVCALGAVKVVSKVQLLRIVKLSCLTDLVVQSCHSRWRY